MATFVHHRRALRGATTLGPLLAAALAIGSLAFLLLRFASDQVRAYARVDPAALSRALAEEAMGEALGSIRRGGHGNLGNEAAPLRRGSASYWVEASESSDGEVRLVSTCANGEARARVEMVVRLAGEDARRFAVFTDAGLGMSGESSIDGYDSWEGRYEDLVARAAPGTPGLAHVGSNGAILLRDSANVRGDARPGPGASVTLRDEARVLGSSQPLEGSSELLPVELPALPRREALVLGGESELRIPAGERGYERIELGPEASLCIEGPARVLTGSLLLRAGAALTIEDAAGPVEIYVVDDLVLEARTSLGSPQRPGALSLFLCADNVNESGLRLDFSAGGTGPAGKLYANVHAPRALIRLDADFELFGTLVARCLDMSDRARIHHDRRASRAAPAEAGYELVSWRSLRPER